MRHLLLRLLNLFRRDDATHELDREITAHLALLEEEHHRRGLTPDQARLAARRAMGSVALAKDLHRDARSFVRLEDLGRDFRHAVRALRRAPGFTLIAVFALGLGIGVNTTFFTIVNAICLRGLPIESPDRVMYVSGRDAQDRTANLSYVEFDELRARHFDTDKMIEAGDLLMLDAREVLATFMEDGQPDAERFNQSVPAAIARIVRGLDKRTVRAYGEMVDLLWKDGLTTAAVKLEMLWNQLARTHDFSLLCGYSMGNFYKDAVVGEITRLHTHLIADTGEAATIN